MKGRQRILIKVNMRGYDIFLEEKMCAPYLYRKNTDTPFEFCEYYVLYCIFEEENVPHSVNFLFMGSCTCILYIFIYIYQDMMRDGKIEDET